MPSGSAMTGCGSERIAVVQAMRTQRSSEALPMLTFRCYASYVNAFQASRWRAAFNDTAMQGSARTYPLHMQRSSRAVPQFCIATVIDRQLSARIKASCVAMGACGACKSRISNVAIELRVGLCRCGRFDTLIRYTYLYLALRCLHDCFFRSERRSWPRQQQTTPKREALNSSGSCYSSGRM